MPKNVQAKLLITTEYLDNDAEATDRDDDWEWDRQDDFGDPWDREY